MSGAGISATMRPAGESGQVRATAANAARIYDALLGGEHATNADRDAAGELLRLVPDAVMAACQSRQFIRRAIRFLTCHTGVRQFIDIGAGLPVHDMVHDVAEQAAPGAHVVYVDNDPFVLSCARALTNGHTTTAVIDHDLRDPAGILRHPTLQAHVDLDKPVAILLASVLHFIEDAAHPYDLVDQLTTAAAPGSYLALSHVTGDHLPISTVRQVRDLYDQTGSPVYPRSATEIAAFLTGLELLPPGLVNSSAWRPGFAAPEPRRTLFYAALGRKPGKAATLPRHNRVERVAREGIGQAHGAAVRCCHAD